jgi:hypothetical protein
MVSGPTFHISDPHAQALQFGPRNIENVLRNLHLEHERRGHEAAMSYFGLSCGALEGSYLGFASQLNPTYPAKTPIFDPLSSPEPCQPCSNPTLNSCLLLTLSLTEESCGGLGSCMPSRHGTEPLHRDIKTSLSIIHERHQLRQNKHYDGNSADTPRTQTTWLDAVMLYRIPQNSTRITPRVFSPKQSYNQYFFIF